MLVAQFVMSHALLTRSKDSQDEISLRTATLPSDKNSKANKMMQSKNLPNSIVVVVLAEKFRPSFGKFEKKFQE